MCSKRSPKLLFGNWTLWDLNPGNYSLKNDFQDNLIYIGSMASRLAMSLTREGLKIIKAYEPNSLNPDATKFEKYHQSGSALALSWNEFSKEDTKTDVRIQLFLDRQDSDYVSVAVYDDMIRIIQDGKACLYEIVDGKERVLYRKLP